MNSTLYVLVAVAIAALTAFGAVVFIYGRAAGLSKPIPDGVPRGVPDGGLTPRLLTSDDLSHVRFDRALRGYRRQDVDIFLRKEYVRGAKPVDAKFSVAFGGYRMDQVDAILAQLK